ncbi:exodeoxyribonuclease V subunit alpha [Actinobacillus succinogenes]|uniref:RecBCD enzyme subunit RecD n=1 Tax=Actinobacillus succinogenes (strain ATCC 55618 / DSM 22257 / CCUG 43843 / 130Z) TaxID=339671 RepID=A6VNK0_ACTSZ|nr:exodeoxyribonuclease V subunit alpha [Actinobacillus succinogenes]ABR74547.1 exodeoxyribonuclease V, alpha subunit [Actinobacillus succinogenes 130Z]PHI41032.1 exodeoxyribonuclease V subunit alpha [Actinobacillus succinogenes]
MLNVLARLKALKVLTEADFYFAKLIDEKQQGMGYDETRQALAVLLAALVHAGYLQGNSCLFLDQDLERNPFALAYRTLDDERDYLLEIKQKINFLPVEQWQTALAGHIAFTDTPQEQSRPFVFQHNAVYLYRLWQDEQTVANYLKSAVKNPPVFVPTENARNLLSRFFGEKKQETDWQKIAVATALIQPFTLISGGPGTGKTYSVARLVAAVQTLQYEQQLPPLRIRLAAPTGKAAARLKESLEASLLQLDLPSAVRENISTESVTLHRLLGVRPFEDSVRFHAGNPLPLDLLIIDEASMIDLSMMAKLLRALPLDARLILLGDKDQLASVEAGAVLGELGQFLRYDYSPEFAAKLQELSGERINGSANCHNIRHHLAFLTRSTRFNADSAVGRLAVAVNNMRARESWRLLQDGTDIPLLEFVEPADNAKNRQAVRHYYLSRLLQSAVENYQHYLKLIPQNDTPTEVQLRQIFRAFNSVRILTALRAGEFGVENLNRQIAEALRQKGLVRFKHSRDWFAGKPIMVTQNDNSAKLFNGDIGLYLGNNLVYFEAGDGYNSVSVQRIPLHEPAFAMTIHKSQGSEFEHTVVVLPPDYSPILSKELLYTAVTRAKPRLSVFASEEIWLAAVRNPIKRQSGLGTLLEQTDEEYGNPEP